MFSAWLKTGLYPPETERSRVEISNYHLDAENWTDNMKTSWKFNIFMKTDKYLCVGSRDFLIYKYYIVMGRLLILNKDVNDN